MSELVSLLERTAPDAIAPVDVAAIARSARRRTRRRRAGTTLAVLVVLGVVGAGVMSANPDRPDPAEQVVAESPDTRRLESGMGEWQQLPDAPFAALSAAEPLADGRLLAWGDTRDQVGDNEEVGDAGLRIATYDPSSRAWTPIAHPSGLDLLTNEQMLVAADRLLYLGMDETGVYSGAVLDVAAESWTEVPRLEDVKVDIGSVAWDGTTLIAVRTDLGDEGPVGVGLPPHDVNDPDDGVATIDYRVDAPTTRRWAFGADGWTVGAPPPLSPRIAVGDALADGTLAIVGGTTGATGTADTSKSLSDGALYDVGADAWTVLPDLPWRAVNMGVGWVDGQLVVAGGTPSLDVTDSDAPLESVVRLAADGGSWVALPSSPGQGAAVRGPHRRSSPELGSAEVIMDEPMFFDGGQPESVILIDGAWEAAPTRTFDDWDGLLVASTDRLGNGGDRPFEVAVRRGTDDWVPTAAAPFTDRMNPAVAFVGDRLYFGGGLTGSNIEPDATFWVLDLSGTR